MHVTFHYSGMNRPAFHYSLQPKIGGGGARAQRERSMLNQGLLQFSSTKLTKNTPARSCLHNGILHTLTYTENL